jgi:two-component system chemotaxis response regulator CheB
MTLRVLVVDDSAFARKVMREVLSRDPEIEVVGIARDGLDALEKIHELKPDVITLDLVMPNLNGLGVLNALRGRNFPRAVIVSMSDAESDLAVAALQAGAVELVHKPTALATDMLYDLADELLNKVKAAGAAKVTLGAPHPPRISSVRPLTKAVAPLRVVVIGASTGGPQALTRLLGELPSDFPLPIAIVLHMPIGYTAALADRLNSVCALAVSEAREDVELTAGMVVIARAGMHLVIASGARDGGPRTKLEFPPMNKPHRPSVDVLFASAASACGAGVLGVVLTGMGEDGLIGARAIKEAGGTLLHEAEESCVVYGMPRAIAEAGLSSGAVTLEAMAAALDVRVRVPPSVPPPPR